MVVKIEDFSRTKNIDYGKVFLVLYFKKITWKAELQKEYMISSEIITNSIKILKTWDLALEVDFEFLGLKEKENVWEFNSSYYELLKKKPTVFKLGTNFNEGEGYYLLEGLKKEAKTNENLRNFIRVLINKTKIKNDEFGFYKLIKTNLMNEKNSKNQQENSSNLGMDIEVNMEEIEYFKVFLVLHMKGFSWKKELENDFNISKSVVLKSIELLERRGFIIAKDFWSLDLDSQECIRRLNGAYMSLIKTHPQIYTLSFEGREFGNEIIGKYKKIAKNNSSLRATIEYVSEKVRAYNVLKEKFEKLENSNWVRHRIDHETGIIYQTDTKKKIEFEKKLNLALKKLRKEILERKKIDLLSNSAKQELALLQSKNIAELVEFEMKNNFNSKNGFLYNGKQINSIERSEIEEKISKIKKEDKKLNKIKAKIGLDESVIEREHLARFEELKKQLGIIQENKNLAELKKNKELCNKIIKQIKKKKWLDVWLVQKQCSNERVYNLFLKMAKENNIENDGEDFRYISNSKK